MPSITCAHCGLVNFSAATICQRCNAVLNQGSAGLVTKDGYVLPPPPTVGVPVEGVWRNRSTLVMSKNATLPNRCLKCNQDQLPQWQSA